MPNDIVSNNRGLGNWEFTVYNPVSHVPIGPIKGYLVINKDHHVVFADANLTKTLLNIPSQNVAWVCLVQKDDV